MMEIKFDITQCERKELAHKIADLIDYDCKYAGMPSKAYCIGDFTLTFDGVLQFSDRTDSELVETVLDGLNAAGYRIAPPENSLTISIPKESLPDDAKAKLEKLITNKETLFRHAFQTETLAINETESAFEFPWFTVQETDDAEAYSIFITKLCEFAKTQKRVNRRPDNTDNEKFSFRCFLIRLGFVGKEFQQTRKILLRHLTGSSAYRFGNPKVGTSDENTQSAGA